MLSRPPTFDGERSKLGELQVEFVARLANSLGVELVKAEALRAMRERPSNPDAVDLSMRGWGERYRDYTSKASQDAAVSFFERALAIDPQLGPPMVGLARTLVDRVRLRHSVDPNSDIARAEDWAERAVAAEPDSSAAHMAKAWVFVQERQWAQAIAEAEAAVADDPNNPEAAVGPQNWYAFVDLAAANAWAGHDKDAKEAVARLQKAYPGFTVQTWLGIHFSDDPTFNAQYARIAEGLRKAGLPEYDRRPPKAKGGFPPTATSTRRETPMGLSPRHSRTLPKAALRVIGRGRGGYCRWASSMRGRDRPSTLFWPTVGDARKTARAPCASLTGPSRNSRPTARDGRVGSKAHYCAFGSK